MNPDLSIDVLMCVGRQDVETFFLGSLYSCVEQFGPLRRLYIVTPDKRLVEEKVKTCSFFDRLVLLQDEEVLDPSLWREDGWYKQQVIKLSADQICQSRFVACMGSDTLLLQPLSFTDLFSSPDSPFLYYRSSIEFSPHDQYEQQRLKSIEAILKTQLLRAESLVNFILDFTVWDTQLLSSLRKYLKGLYGSHPYRAISPGPCRTLDQKTKFGEWSLYAAFVLDVLKLSIMTKPFGEEYFFQIHSLKDLWRCNFSSKIVHFVLKDF